MAELSLVQSHHILPAELPGTGESPQVGPVAVVPEKSTSIDALATANSELVAHATEWTYPDGGLRAWLVVLGCFIMASTCMYASLSLLSLRAAELNDPQGVGVGLGRVRGLLSLKQICWDEFEYAQPRWRIVLFREFAVLHFSGAHVLQ